MSSDTDKARPWWTEPGILEPHGLKRCGLIEGPDWRWATAGETEGLPVLVGIGDKGELRGPSPLRYWDPHRSVIVLSVQGIDGLGLHEAAETMRELDYPEARLLALPPGTNVNNN